MVISAREHVLAGVFINIGPELEALHQIIHPAYGGANVYRVEPTCDVGKLRKRLIDAKDTRRKPGPTP